MRQDCAKPDNATGLIDRGCLHRGDLMLAEGLAHDIEPARQRRRITERPFSLAAAIRSDGPGQDFFGLTSWAWALASAAAMVPK